ncbi:fimbrillin family protein [Alistipes communis]|jgi:lipoprotein|uniref:fimbrillin family protein n=1 Tax=Alistipes communis TaxID=2585118 RepID=UPI002943AC7B|nr:fimbrillin family protein [Alistipes communis]
MRKMQKTLMLVAAAAMALAGCSKEDVSDNALPGSGIKATRGFTAEIASSRTTLNDAATRMKWTAGDQLGFYTDVETDLNVASSTYAEGATNFTAEIDTKATKVYAYYPYFSSQKDRTYENVSLYIEDAQTQTEAGVLNGNMVGMYASATLAEGQNTVLTFTPIASLIAFNIYDAENNGDAVKSITFTPAGGEKLNGQHIYNLETGKTTSTGTKESATVTLTTPYAVPAAKPADKAGYIYLAVTPKSYAGGTFTVVTDKGLYTFETTKSFDLSNVYAPQVIQMNLAKVRQPAPTVNHIFYDDFSTATGTNDYFSMKVSPADYAYYYTDTYTREGSVYAFNGAIRMGVSKTTGTVTTPALKLIEGTKNLKVTFYANGWKADQALNVTASTGMVVGGSDLVMPQATDTGSGVMDKSEAALFTVYVENADATTALTFALASTTVDKRFILDDLTVDVHDGPIELTPVILADDITGVAAAGATDATFTYEVRNDNNYTASVECDGTVVTAASVENATKTITYSVSENTDTANDRSGWIKIVLNDTAFTSLTINVTQNQSTEGMSVYELVDAAQEDWSGDYLMVGNVNKKYYTLTNTKVVTNNIIAAAEITSSYNDGVFVADATLDQSICHFEKQLDDTYAITVEIQGRTYYISATTSDKKVSHLEEATDYSYWNVAFNASAKTFTMTNKKVTAQLFQFNASSPRFTTYTSKSNQQKPQLYKRK